MTYPDPSPQPSLSESLKRQLITAAHDAGLGNIINATSLTQKTDSATIELTPALVRALTTWLVEIASLTNDQPITARVVPSADDASTDAWMRNTTDGIHTVPVGFKTATFPNRSPKDRS